MCLASRAKLYTVRGKLFVLFKNFHSPCLKVSWLAAESLQILSVGWLVVTHNPRYSLTNINQRDHRLPGLRIDKVELGDTGEYQCQVVGPAGGTTTVSILLQVSHLHLSRKQPVFQPLIIYT